MTTTLGRSEHSGGAAAQVRRRTPAGPPPSSLISAANALRLAALLSPLAAGFASACSHPCPLGLVATEQGRVSDPDLDEASGLVWGGAGAWWTHNDDGDPSMYVLNDDGDVTAIVELGAVDPVDIEDVAMRWEGGQPVELLVGDIGGESGDRESIAVYRLDPTSPTTGTVDVGFEIWTYPDGEDRDAEALLIDPTDGRPYVVTQEKDGGGRLLRAGATPKVETVLEDLGTLAAIGSTPITAGDVSPDGAWVALRSRDQVWLWERAEGQTLDVVLAGEPCVSTLTEEPQGESIAFDSNGFVTLSEGVNQPLLRYEWPVR